MYLVKSELEYNNGLVVRPESIWNMRGCHSNPGSLKSEVGTKKRGFVFSLVFL